MKQLIEYSDNSKSLNIIVDPELDFDCNILFEDLPEHSGVILTQFLDKAICESIVDQVSKVPRNNFNEVQKGFVTLPTSVGHKSKKTFQENQVLTDEDLWSVSEFRSSFSARFGINLERKIGEALIKLFKANSGNVPSANESGDSLSPFSIRLLEPSAEIYLHCGNYVQQRHSEYYSRISKNVRTENQLSYFLVLQEPEIGGELEVYNARWEDYKQRDPFENLIDDDQNIFSPRKPGYCKVSPKVGDLLIFSGGQYWHRVNKVGGGQTRYTLGGFIGKGLKGNEVFFWS